MTQPHLNGNAGIMDKPKKHAGGRPTKYNPETCPDKARKLALLGLTDEEMAVALDITTSTFYKWLNEHSEFSEAIKNSKVIADAEVAQSLYKKALTGDTTSAIFWLKNRQSRQWRDKTHTVLQNPDGSPFVFRWENAGNNNPVQS